MKANLMQSVPNQALLDGFQTIDERKKMRFLRESQEQAINSMKSSENHLKIPTATVNLDQFPVLNKTRLPRNKTTSKTNDPQTTKAMESQGLTHYPSQSKLKSDAEKPLALGQGQGNRFRIAIP